MKKRILLAATDGNDFTGGASKSLLFLAINLKKLGFDIIIWVPNKGILQERLLKLGFECIYGKEYNEWVVPNTKLTIKKRVKNVVKDILNKFNYSNKITLLKEVNPDFIHINAITADYDLASAAEALDIPVVWHIREFLEEDLSQKFLSPKKQLTILNKSRGMIAISNEVKNKWKRRVSTSVSTVYNGVDVHNYIIKNKKLNNHCNIILYGRITEGKNQLFFLKGVNDFILRGVKADVHFYLAGAVSDELYFHKCREYIKKYNLQKYVSYLGEVTDIKNLLQDQNIVCVCSKREAFGRVNVEALMGRCLVVASDSGANKEIITDGENGYIYKHDDLDSFVDKLTKAIKNRNNFDYDKIQSDAVKKFSAEENAKNVVKVYKKLGLVD